jgi:hypothetical protein
LADRGKSAARVDWQQAFLLTVAFVLALARPHSAHAFQPLDPNRWPFIPVPDVATGLNGGTTYGLTGSRAIADPFVVGFVDVGYGDEGIAIFSGIDYPF